MQADLLLLVHHEPNAAHPSWLEKNQPFQGCCNFFFNCCNISSISSSAFFLFLVGALLPLFMLLLRLPPPLLLPAAFLLPLPLLLLLLDASLALRDSFAPLEAPILLLLLCPDELVLSPWRVSPPSVPSFSPRDSSKKSTNSSPTSSSSSHRLFGSPEAPRSASQLSNSFSKSRNNSPCATKETRYLRRPSQPRS